MHSHAEPLIEADALRRVLIVDDDPDFADTLRRLLTLEGYAAECAHTAAAAREALHRSPAAVALVDIRLGTESGLGLATELRRRWPEVTCVIMTAYASTDTAIRALKEGAYDYLCKPFLTEDLLATLERCLERAMLTRGRREAEAALRRRNRELETLNARLQGTVASIRELSTCASPEELVAQTVSQIARSIGAAEAAACMLPIPAARTVPGRAAELARAFLAALGDSSGQGGEDTPAQPWPEGEAGAALMLPLTGERQSLSAILVFEAPADRPFTAQDRELGVILASYASGEIRLLKALERLSISEERLRHTVDASPSLIMLTDPAGRLVVANRRLGDWHGISREEALGKPWQAAFPQELASIYAQAGLDSRTPLEDPVEREIEAPSADGSTRPLLLTVFPVRDPQGRPVGRGAIAADISEHRRAQEHLRRSQKMEILGRVAGGLAHDFNNLLAIISGNLDLLRVAMTSDPRKREAIEDALASARTGTELVRQLLDFGRGQPPDPRPIDMLAHVAGTCRLLQRTLGDRIRLEQDLHPDLWAVNVDRNQLEASLLNLALNARDAMPAGGRLRIQAMNVWRGRGGTADPADGASPHVAITLTDNGAGMSPAVLERACEPFFTTKPAGHGSGLGLSMVQAFAEQSGGQVELESSPGAGTTVRLYLPAVSADAGAAAPSESPAEAGPSRSAEETQSGDTSGANT